MVVLHLCAVLCCCCRRLLNLQKTHTASVNILTVADPERKLPGEDEALEAPGTKRRRRRMVGNWEWRLGVLGSVVSSSSGVRVDPRSKTILTHFSHYRTLLVEWS